MHCFRKKFILDTHSVTMLLRCKDLYMYVPGPFLFPVLLYSTTGGLGTAGRERQHLGYSYYRLLYLDSSVSACVRNKQPACAVLRQV